MFLTVSINVVLALVVATGLKHDFTGSQFLRVLFYAPAILSVSVLGIIGIRIWDTQLGMVNYFVTTLLDGPRISWLGQPESGHPFFIYYDRLVVFRLSHVGLYGRPAKYPGSAL